MKSLVKNTFGTTLHMAVFHGLFFCGFFLYFWLYGNTRLIYHAFGRFVDYPLFYTGWDFFRTSIDHPGGIVEYINGFLSQLYYYPIGGAIVMTIVISLTCLATGILAGKRGTAAISPVFSPAVIIAYIPAIFFLAMHTKCEHPLGVFIALLINLWAVVAYAKIPLKGFVARCCLFIVMFALLYLTAAASALLFGILASGYELFVRRRSLSSVACILLTGLIPLALGWCFDLRLMNTYLYSLPFDPNWPIFEHGFSYNSKTTASALYLAILCIMLAVFVGQFFSSKKTSAKKSEKTSPDTGKVGLARLGWLAGPVVVITVAVMTVLLSTGKQKQYLQADFYADNAMWTELLKYADRYPFIAENPVGSHTIIQALHHTDQLASKMFAYPYFKESLFVPPENQGNVRGYRRGIYSIRLLLLMGRINVAEKGAYEILENAGRFPEILWQLAMINIAKKQSETAQVFLNVLSRDLIHGNKAESLLKRLAEDPELSNDEEIIRMRSVMLKKDHDGSESLETLMSNLLEVNPHNKIAFEYLMNYYLLSKKVDKVAANIYRFRNFGYKKIPQHYEEAILLHIAKTKGAINAHGWTLDPQTIAAAKQFMTAIKHNPPSRPSSAGNLAPQFGNSYFYYYTFTRSGAGR